MKEITSGLVQTSEVINTMTSLQMAEITGKNHCDLLQAIRRMEPAWEKVRKSKFTLSQREVETPTKGKRMQPYYILTKTESLYIATKFKDEARAKLVLRWEQLEMERQQPSLPTTYKDALKQLLLQVEANEHLQVENEQQRIQIEKKDEIINEQSTQLQKAAPKVKYYEDTLQSVNTYTTTQIAKELGYTASMLNGCLNKAKIQYYQSGTWMLYSPYCGWRLHRMRTHTFDRNDGSKGSSTQMVWTERGRFFINQLHRYGFDVKLTLKMIKGEEASNG